MANIDEAIVEEVVEQFRGPVKRPMLELAIFHINTDYSKQKKAGVDPIDFETILEDVIDRCDLRTLFELDPYKHALGTYYAKRRAKEKRAREERKEAIGTVKEPSDQAVTIRASGEVEIRFKALKSSGKLSFSDIDTGLERIVLYGHSDRVHEELYLKAKRQALAIMNSRRTY